MMKNIWKKGLVLGAALLLAACGSEGDSQAGNAGDSETINIGILQLMDHESLNSTRQGFLDVLEEAGYVEGENLNLDYQNAQLDQSNLQTMSERLAGENDLILAIATSAAQSIANIEKEIPILFTAVTDPLEANLVESLDAPGGNVTGMSDIGPIDQQVSLLLSLIEEPSSIGIIYNSSEPNSVIQGNEAKAHLEAAGVEVVTVTVPSTNDVQTGMESLANEVQGIYIPTDNTLASTMSTVASVAIDYQLPVVAASTDQVMDGGLATYGIDYYDLGRETGKMALEILENGAEPATLPVGYSDEIQLVVNEEIAEALGINPDDIVIP